MGEDPQTNPQGKLHSEIVEANGWLYMSTHFSSELPGAYNQWSGSHVIGYELATGAFRDYGVVHPNYTSYSAVGVDPVRNYLYVFVTGQNTGNVSYLYRIHTVTGAKTNLGQVGRDWDGSFWMFVDQRGDVWFSVASSNGALHRVRGATGQIDVFPNALPPMYRWDAEQLMPSAQQANRWIMWMQPLDGDRALFTLGWEGGMLYQFDSSKPIGSGQEFQLIKHIGFSDLGLAIGGNRVFYYQRANRGFGQQDAQDFHLLSVSLDSAAGYPIADHGLLKDQSGRLLWRAPGMATNGQNRVFLIGDWWTIQGDLGTLRYNYNAGVETYQQLPRGEFLAFADVDTASTPAIRYTVDGTSPINTSTSYTGPITVSATTTVKARAFAPNMQDSGEASATFTIALPTVATPTITPAGGSFSGPVSVTLASATSGATIRYTTNGTTPTNTAASTLYGGAFTVSATSTVKARAFATNMQDSGEASATFTIALPTVATPTITPAGGSFSGPVSVTLASRRRERRFATRPMGRRRPIRRRRRCMAERSRCPRRAR